jgi:hypothetical protein
MRYTFAVPAHKGHYWRVHAAGERCFQHKGLAAMVPLEKLTIALEATDKSPGRVSNFKYVLASPQFRKNCLSSVVLNNRCFEPPVPFLAPTKV